MMMQHGSDNGCPQQQLMTKGDAKNEMGDDGQQQGHASAPPLPLPPLVHPYVVLASQYI